MTSKFALTQTGLGPSEPASDEARRCELLARVIAGKLSIEALCERQHITPADVREWLRGFRRVALEAFDEQLRRTLLEHGAEPDEPSGSEMTVSLEDISIIDWIQAIQLFAKHAVITIRHDDRESRLWCHKGTLIDAESGQLSGEAAVHRIVSLDKGRVVTELRRVQRERRIFTSTPGLLLEAARRKDEAALLRRRLGDLERRFRYAPAVRQRPLTGDEAIVARVFEQPHRLSEAIDHGELGEVETLAAIESLIRMNHLVEASDTAEPVRSSGTTESEAGPRSTSSGLPISFIWHSEQDQRYGKLRWLASTLVMVLAVSLAAWLGATGSQALPAPPAPAAPSTAVLQARAVEMYAAEVRAYPPEAALEIDGLAVGTGHWFARFPKDGATHELRITAPGFIPARILFIDTPPPLQVRLEALVAQPPPIAPPAQVEPAAAPLREAPSGPRSRRKPGSQRKRPYVQIIDGEPPSVPAE